jgi:hypothetical protein
MPTYTALRLIQMQEAINRLGKNIGQLKLLRKVKASS